MNPIIPTTYHFSEREKRDHAQEEPATTASSYFCLSAEKSNNTSNSNASYPSMNNDPQEDPLFRCLSPLLPPLPEEIDEGEKEEYYSKEDSKSSSVNSFALNTFFDPSPAINNTKKNHNAIPETPRSNMDMVQPYCLPVTTTTTSKFSGDTSQHYNDKNVSSSSFFGAFAHTPPPTQHTFSSLSTYGPSFSSSPSPSPSPMETMWNPHQHQQQQQQPQEIPSKIKLRNHLLLLKHAAKCKIMNQQNQSQSHKNDSVIENNNNNDVNDDDDDDESGYSTDKCDNYGNNNSNNSSFSYNTQSCQHSSHCAFAKRLLAHIKECKISSRHSPHCSFKYCRSSKSLLAHYMKCKDDKCFVCNVTTPPPPSSSNNINVPSTKENMKRKKQELEVKVKAKAKVVEQEERPSNKRQKITVQEEEEQEEQQYMMKCRRVAADILHRNNNKSKRVSATATSSSSGTHTPDSIGSLDLFGCEEIFQL